MGLLMVLPVASWLSQSAVAEPAPVAVTQVQEQTVQQEIQLTGTVTSANAAQLSVSTAGLVSVLHVDEGAYVEAGEPVLELDKELVELEYQRALAAKEQAEVALNDAKRRLREAQSLAKQKNIAATTVKDREAEVAANQAALQQAKASVAYQQALLQRHTLRAPFAGVIAARNADLGEWVTPGLGVFDLVATESLRLDFAVAETYLSKIRHNADITFTIAGQSQPVYHDKVDIVVPVTDPNARTFLLRVTLPTAVKQQASEQQSTLVANGLLPGMSVQARLNVPTGNKGVVVPRDALLRYPDGRTVVWTIVDSEQGAVVQESPVELGASYDGLVEIVSGLQVGSEVVVQGNEALQHGQAVKRVKAKSLLAK